MKLTTLLATLAVLATTTSPSLANARGNDQDQAAVYAKRPPATTPNPTMPRGGPLHEPNLRLFADRNLPWNKKVMDAPLAKDSKAIIANLQRVGFGTGSMRTDFGISVLRDEAKGTGHFRTFKKTDEFYEPDCDFVPVPMPAGGSIENSNNYQCVDDGDCHLIVHNVKSNKLYEMWRANLRGNLLSGGCLAVWDTQKTYLSELRGLGCTSADAGGFPLAAMLFTADELRSGKIDHAIRFILPNKTMRRGVYVRPATHGTKATKGPSDAIPYGSRLRLKKSFDMRKLPNEAARVVARALQEYGMILADGGKIALTAASDKYGKVKYADVGFGPRSLAAIKPEDFEVVAPPGGDKVLSIKESCRRV
ncbi:hypothetical protein BCR44DRAFT_33747 [Catenaria anguillulae PL171]|uniref:Uncharacterized protein n=1 Tax=Catenaria anguillulae PL171 TaxID=765915 RepID=A0A1Y2HCZ6_9FUNG|nr:hypothetical protein BCR44DRAFT_33747 [Catenaria anguillulae PL171]